MRLKTSKMGLFYKKSDSESSFLNLITHTVSSYCSYINKNVTFFHNYLSVSPKQAPKFLNPNNEEKQLRLIDFLSILKNLDSNHQKILLDSLCSECNFICSESADTLETQFTSDHSMFNINALLGTLNQSYLDAKEDDFLSNMEIDILIQNSYYVRQALIDYENKMRSLIQNQK